MVTMELSAGAVFTFGMIVGAVALGITIIIAAYAYSKKSK